MSKEKSNYIGGGGGSPNMKKDPTLACLLNLLFLGTGHMYLGRIAKGILILFLGVGAGMTVWPLSVLIIIWAMYDAYKSAQKLNKAVRTRVG